MIKRAPTIGDFVDIKVKDLKVETIKNDTKQIILTLTQNGKDTDIVFQGDGKAKLACTSQA